MMLTKAEIVKLSVMGVIVIALAVTCQMLLSAQDREMENLKREASGASSTEALAQRHADIKKAKKMAAENARWKALLDKVEKYFPRGEKNALSNVQVAGSIPKGVTLINTKKGALKSISWQPPQAAGGEEVSEEDRAKLAVKYGEQELSLTVKGPFAGWLEFLQGLESRHSFYRLKDFTLRNASSRGVSPDILIDVKLGSYFVVEFPSERKDEEKESK